MQCDDVTMLKFETRNLKLEKIFATRGNSYKFQISNFKKVLYRRIVVSL